MFNFYVFQQTLLVLLCLAVIAGCSYVVRWHTWMALRVTCVGLVLLAVAAVAGVICA